MAPALDLRTSSLCKSLKGMSAFPSVSWSNQETERPFSPAVLISSHARCSFFRSSATFVRLSGNITCPKKGRTEGGRDRGRGRFNPLALVSLQIWPNLAAAAEEVTLPGSGVNSLTSLVCQTGSWGRRRWVFSTFVTRRYVYYKGNIGGTCFLN